MMKTGKGTVEIMKMGESIITDVHVGKYVLVQLVDETMELTVENNVYSLSEALDLIKELKSLEWKVEAELAKRIDENEVSN